MNRTEQLIKHIRLTTDNSQLNVLPDDTILEFINDAQNRIQSLIFQEFPNCNLFDSVGFITTAYAQDEYSLDSLENENEIASIETAGAFTAGERYKIVSVGTTDFKLIGASVNRVGIEFTATGAGAGTGQAVKIYPSLIFADNSVSLIERSDNLTNTFYPLKRISNKERIAGFGYYIRNKNIVISPLPGIGRLRITYAKNWTPLDIRRGQIQTVTAKTSLVLTSGTVPTGSDFSNVDYISVIDADGNVIRSNIKVTSYTSATRTIATPDLLTDVAAGMYVCYGKYATNFFELNQLITRYLKEYVAMRVLMKDTAKDTQVVSGLLATLESEIVKLYSDNSSDAQTIPINSTDYLTM